MTETMNFVPTSEKARQRPGYWTPTLTAGMLAQLKNVSGGQWSPDNRYLYFAIDFDGRADIVQLEVASGIIRQITSDYEAAPMPMMGQRPAVSDFNVAPDGSKLVYLSAKDGKAWLISSQGGVATRLANGEGSQSGVFFSPDSQQVAFVSTFGETQVVAVADTNGEAWSRRISNADKFALAPRWFKDGKQLVFAEYDSHTMPLFENRLMLADLESGQVKILRDGLGNGVFYSNYSPSPDGKWLAYVSDESGWNNLYLLEMATGQSHALVSEKAEYSEPVWSPDSSKIAYLVSRTCNITLRMTTLEGQTHPLDEGDIVCAGLAWSPDGKRLSYSKQSPVMPPNLWVLNLGNGQSQQLTTFAVGGVVEAGLVSAEQVRWTSPDGLEIEGLLSKPANLQKGKHPLLLYIHGGPINQYNRRWEGTVQYWVNRGWVVLQPNFRGSTGYGRDFRNALFGTWGQEDMLDNLGGVVLLKSEGLIDTTRTVAWGLSGGGYATLRLLTGWPDRFKAGVDLEGVSNLVSFPEQTDRPARYLMQDLLGARHENMERYIERSPTYAAANIKAPLLIFMGEKDLRVPPVQGDEMVEALKKAGKTDFEYHTYPGEAHGWRKSSTILDYHQRMGNFLQKWVLER